MIKGSEKRMICIRDTGSPIFTEAYFILRENAASVPKGDMVTEAMRIIRERAQTPSKMAGKRCPDRRSFFAGFLTCAVIFAAAIAVYVGVRLLSA